LQRARVRDIKRIATPGEIDVVAAILGESVVGGIVDPAERQCRTTSVAFSEKIAKFAPLRSTVAPSGEGRPGQTRGRFAF
jgi:hypothetical protein